MSRRILSRLAGRIAEAAGQARGRYDAARDRQRAESLAERPTGRLDHTWSARSSVGSAAYEAGAVGRSTADWRATLTSSTLAIVESLDTMLARSRWLCRNDAYAASAQGGYRRRVVGGGITARASARHPDTGTMLRAYNAAHDLLWQAWAADPRLCDVERTKCLAEKQSVWMDELFAAGGVLLRAVYTPRPDAVGLAIQELEYEQLDAALTEFDGRAVYRGVETDAYSAPVAYHVFAASHPLEDVASRSVRLEASTCWHLFRKTRVRQRLGVPMLAAVMPALRNLAMYELYTLSKARTEAAYHGFIEDAPNSALAIDQVRQRIGAKPPPNEAEDGAERQVRIENGLFPVLKNGQKVTFPAAATPNSVYAQFIAENLKKIAAGAGLDLPTVARWYADGNFNTQRKAQLEVEAEVEAIQDLQFITGALRGIREQWTEIAVREGKLPADGFTQSARWRAAYLMTNWQGPPLRTVDEIKDEAAWDLRYRALRGTPQQYYNAHGLDPRDVLSEWREFLDMARDEYGLGNMVDRFVGGATPNAPKTGMRPDGSGPDAEPGDAGGNGSRGGRSADDGLADLLVREAVLSSLLGGDNGRGT